MIDVQRDWRKEEEAKKYVKGHEKKKEKEIWRKKLKSKKKTDKFSSLEPLELYLPPRAHFGSLHDGLHFFN